LVRLSTSYYWNADIFVYVLSQRVVNVDYKSAAGLRYVTLTDVELAELDVRQRSAQNGQLTPV